MSCVLTENLYVHQVKLLSNISGGVLSPKQLMKQLYESRSITQINTQQLKANTLPIIAHLVHCVEQSTATIHGFHSENQRRREAVGRKA